MRRYDWLIMNVVDSVLAPRAVFAEPTEAAGRVSSVSERVTWGGGAGEDKL